MTARGICWHVLRQPAGGRGGIRTPDTVSRIHTFQACALNHSATLPLADAYGDLPPVCKPAPCRRRGSARFGRVTADRGRLRRARRGASPALALPSGDVVLEPHRDLA